jgi:hypothetical protein
MLLQNLVLNRSSQVVIVGAGPAGLMAAERIADAGYQVHVYDAMPSAGRKFLLAGIGGMNITHSESFDAFIQRYYEQANWLLPMIKAFDANALIEWIHDLGIETFIGSSGRVFPKEMKAAPLLRKWLQRLRESGVTFHMRHRLTSMEQHENKTLLSFINNDGTVKIEAMAVVLAMGGASWPKLGSDGAWQAMLGEKQIIIKPLESTNCGFHVNWSEHIQRNFAGSELKNMAFKFTTLAGLTIERKGECIITEYGLEGSLIYAFSKHFREAINVNGVAQVLIDLIPHYTAAQALQKLTKKRGKSSFAKHLKSTLNISGVQSALLYEHHTEIASQTNEMLAHSLKNISVKLISTRPIEEAISSAGGVCHSSLNKHLMLKQLPGIFCAGEMLDWEAPTGGYLLTACFASGKQAGNGVIQYLN